MKNHESGFDGHGSPDKAQTVRAAIGHIGGHVVNHAEHLARVRGLLRIWEGAPAAQFLIRRLVGLRFANAHLIGQGGFGEETEVGVAFIDYAAQGTHGHVEILNDHASGVGNLGDGYVDRQSSHVRRDGKVLNRRAAQVAE